jgi:hypothetical protein
MALEEWRSGMFKPIDSIEDNLRMLAYSQAENLQLTATFQNFKNKRPHSWLKFCGDVHSFAAGKGRRNFRVLSTASRSASISESLTHLQSLISVESDGEDEEHGKL